MVSAAGLQLLASPLLPPGVGDFSHNAILIAAVEGDQVCECAPEDALQVHVDVLADDHLLLPQLHHWLLLPIWVGGASWKAVKHGQEVLPSAALLHPTPAG